MTSEQWRARLAISRRHFLKVMGASTVVGAQNQQVADLLTDIFGAQRALAASSPVVVENQRSGSTGWYKVFSNQSQQGEIEGYASTTTVAPGGSVSFHVSTAPVAEFRIEIYRIGHYGGDGSRLMDRLPASGTFTGAAQPVPAPDPVTGLVALDWPVTTTLTIPDDWMSGYYIALFEIVSGPAAGMNSVYPFVVTAPPSRQRVGLVHAAATTWQAYNDWPRPSRPGKSLYDYNSPGGRARKVSFHRPYNVAGNQNIFDWEVPFAQWLERHGYDVAYATDIDTHRNPSLPGQYDVVLVNGHDEYWSSTIRGAFDAARDSGVDLGFFGANIAYWQIRLEDAEQTIVCYKSKSADPVTDPAQKTVRFQDLDVPRPEAALLGVQFMWGMPDGYRDFVVEEASLADPWFADTGFMPGDSISKVVGYEYDTRAPSSPSPITVFFSYPGSPAEELPAGHCTRYVHPSGAIVFATGTMQWPIVMRSDARVATFTRNAVDALFAGSVSAPNVEPVVSVVSPADGATVSVGAPVVLSAQASDGDGTVTSVEFLVDDVVVGSANAAPWSTTWTPATAAVVSVSARATDDRGATVTSTPVSVTVTDTTGGLGDVVLVGADAAGDNGNRSSLSLPVPAGVVAGDVIVVGVQTASDITVPTPSGFSMIADVIPSAPWHARISVFAKQATGDETSVRLAMGWVGKSGAIAVYRGAQWPITAGAGLSRDTTALTLPSMTAPANGTRLIGIFGAQNHSTPAGFSPPAGMTEQAAKENLSWLAVALADQTVNTGDTGTRRVTFDTSAALTGLLLTIAPTGTRPDPEPDPDPEPQPNVEPVVSVVSPADGATVSVGAPVVLSAQASDGDGTVTSVEFLVDDVVVGSANAAPWSTTWTPATAAVVSVSARATDDRGATVTSTPVSVTVTDTTGGLGDVVLVGADAAGDNGNRSSLSLPVPAGVVAGDVIVVGVQTASDITVPTPSGFSMIADVIPSAPWHARISVFAKQATGDETSVRLAMGWVGKSGAIAVYRGAQWPITAGAGLSRDTTALTLPSMTAPANGTRLIGIFGAQNHSTPAGFSPPAGMTEQAAKENLSWLAVALADQTVNTGDTGTRRVTFDTSAALTGLLLTIAPTGTRPDPEPDPDPEPQPNVEPVVSVVSPADGATVSVGAPVVLSAQASDGDGTVTSVEFLVDDVVVGSANAAPWSTTWTPATAAVVSVSARATDDRGATVTSTPVSVTVTDTTGGLGDVVLVGADAAGDNGNRSSLSLPVPAGVVAGDVIVVGVQTASDITVPTPSGFSMIADVIPSAPWHARISVFAKQATGDETSVRLAMGWVGKSGAIAVYRGAQWPITAGAGLSRDTTALTLPSMTAPANGTRLIGIFGAQNHSTPAGFSPPAGMTEQAAKENLSWLAVALADQTVNTGDTGTRRVTFDTNTALTGILLTIAPVG